MIVLYCFVGSALSLNVPVPVATIVEKSPHQDPVRECKVNYSRTVAEVMTAAAPFQLQKSFQYERC